MKQELVRQRKIVEEKYESEVQELRIKVGKMKESGKVEFGCQIGREKEEKISLKQQCTMTSLTN